MDEYISPTDPARVAEAEAIIDRVAALKPDHEYETNGLTWAVAAFAVGLTDMVKEAETERDRLRADRDDWRNVADDFSAELADTKAERDRLRAVVEAFVDFRTKQDAALHADAEPEVEIGLTDIAFSAWRDVTAMLDQLDVSPRYRR